MSYKHPLAVHSGRHLPLLADALTLAEAGYLVGAAATARLAEELWVREHVHGPARAFKGSRGAATGILLQMLGHHHVDHRLTCAKLKRLNSHFGMWLHGEEAHADHPLQLIEELTAILGDPTTLAVEQPVVLAVEEVGSHE